MARHTYPLTGYLVCCCCCWLSTTIGTPRVRRPAADSYVTCLSLCLLNSKSQHYNEIGGAVAEWVRTLAWTGDRTVRDGFESHCGQLRFRTLAIPFRPTPPCQCLSEETLKAVGPSIWCLCQGKYKIPPVRTGMCNYRGLHHPL